MPAPRETKFKFYMPCDRFRRNGGEAHWQEIMLNRWRLRPRQFMQDCDFTGLLDEGETPKKYIQRSRAEDPDLTFYASHFDGGRPCRFMEYAGFEFIFLQDDGR